MISVKTPLRVSLFGGGSDVPEYFKINQGKVLTFSIDKYVYTSLKLHNKIFKENFRLNYFKTEITNNLNGIKNDIIRETLKYFNIENLYVSTISDLPSGTGLGSSSAFTVGLIKALIRYKNRELSNIQIAKLACKIEVNFLKKPIGFQDQFSTSLGGFRSITFNRKEVKTKKINLSKVTKKKIFNNLFLIWTGIKRDADKILKNQNLPKKIKFNLNNIKKTVEKVNYFEKKFLQDSVDIDELAESLDESWQMKKNYSRNITNNRINELYEICLNHGGLGGKLCGAGGGGFLLIVTNDKNRQRLKKFLNKEKIHFEKIDLDLNGSILI